MSTRRVVLVSSLLLLSTLGGCSSSGQHTKVPSSAGSPTVPSTPTTSRTFTSSISSMPGLRFVWPTPGWRPVDTAAQVIAHPPALPGATLRVTKGLFPTDPSGAVLTTRISAVAVINALRRLPDLRASRPVRERIGDRLAVEHVDVRLSPSAPREGFEYLTYRGSSITAAAFAIKRGMTVRVYAGVYRAPYGRELLDIAVEAPTGKIFDQWTSLATRALLTLRLPNGLVPGRTIYN